MEERAEGRLLGLSSFGVSCASLRAHRSCDSGARCEGRTMLRHIWQRARGIDVEEMRRSQLAGRFGWRLRTGCARPAGLSVCLLYLMAEERSKRCIWASVRGRWIDGRCRRRSAPSPGPALALSHSDSSREDSPHAARRSLARAHMRERQFKVDKARFSTPQSKTTNVDPEVPALALTLVTCSPWHADL